MLLRLLLILSCLFFAILPVEAKRVALVMGNSNYKNVMVLANPTNDAKLMDKALRDAGFEVTLVLDADKDTMGRALLEFGRVLRKGVDASMFYYAGHGVQVAGENYLVPINATLESEDEVDLQTYPVNAFLRTMESAKSRVNIVVFDACRNNPFSRGFRGTGGGLAPVNAPRGSYIAYATAPGAVAADGEGGNSPYTVALASILATPGLKLEDVFKKTREKVLASTDEKQVPWETSSITGDFYFHDNENQRENNSADKPISGQIKDFECGDNCYLTITKGPGEELSALCVAEACDPWNSANEIPKELLGRDVTVTIGTGVQLDGNGDVVGDFPSFTSVMVK